MLPLSERNRNSKTDAEKAKSTATSPTPRSRSSNRSLQGARRIQSKLGSIRKSPSNKGEIQPRRAWSKKTPTAAAHPSNPQKKSKYKSNYKEKYKGVTESV
ncbi:hypothetical protein GCK32_016778, partial [Trichostrongylus colubriformis]